MPPSVTGALRNLMPSCFPFPKWQVKEWNYLTPGKSQPPTPPFEALWLNGLRSEKGITMCPRIYSFISFTVCPISPRWACWSTGEGCRVLGRKGTYF